MQDPPRDNDPFDPFEPADPAAGRPAPPSPGAPAGGSRTLPVVALILMSAAALTAGVCAYGVLASIRLTLDQPFKWLPAWLGVFGVATVVAATALILSIVALTRPPGRSLALAALAVFVVGGPVLMWAGLWLGQAALTSQATAKLNEGTQVAKSSLCETLADHDVDLPTPVTLILDCD